MINGLLTKHSVFDLSSCLMYIFRCTPEQGERDSSVSVIINVNSVNLVRNVYLQDNRTLQPSWLSLYSMSGV